MADDVEAGAIPVAYTRPNSLPTMIDVGSASLSVLVVAGEFGGSRDPANGGVERRSSFGSACQNVACAKS
jgi:hypothetical protein